MSLLGRLKILLARTPPGRALMRRRNRVIVPPGFTRIGDFLPEDVFVVGYPKSGNTWFQNLAACAIYGLHGDPAPPMALVQDLSPDVHYQKLYRRYRTPTVFKSHFLPRPEYRRVVYLVRDGRDVMVSYRHHLSALAGREIGLDELLTDSFPFDFSTWEDHVRRWTANPFSADMIIIRYEDLKAEPLRELKRFCAFLRIERDDSLLTQAIESSSFERMREREKREGSYNPAWPSEVPFVRKGNIGSFRTELRAETITELERRAGDMLRQHGYPIGSDPHSQ